MLFLEEDHHVSEDFLYILGKINEKKEGNNKDCDIICLGSYLKNNNNLKGQKKVRFINCKHTE